MTDRMQAPALALDAYQQHLFGDLANGHRHDRAEAEGLLHSLVADLIGYGEGNHLDVVDLIDALVQARLDRGGALISPRYSFRLNTEVQFRNRDADDHRGFITELRATGPGQDAECVLRVPGTIDPQHTVTSALEPATPMVPLLTHTCGTVFSALEAEEALIDILGDLPDERARSNSDPHLLADLIELSTALATWSGTTFGRVLRHLRNQAGEGHPMPADRSTQPGTPQPRSRTTSPPAWPASSATCRPPAVQVLRAQAHVPA